MSSDNLGVWRRERTCGVQALSLASAVQTQIGLLGTNGTIAPITIPPPAIATHVNGRLQQQLSPRSTTPHSVAGARGSASPSALAKHNAFHVTTRLSKDSKQEENKRPPPHMLLQSVQGPMQAVRPPPSSTHRLTLHS